MGSKSRWRLAAAVLMLVVVAVTPGLILGMEWIDLARLGDRGAWSITLAIWFVGAQAVLWCWGFWDSAQTLRS